jgi:hypothetical protein
MGRRVRMFDANRRGGRSLLLIDRVLACMDKLTIGFLGMLLSSFLLAVDTRPAWAIMLVVCGVITGWCAGERLSSNSSTA